MFDADQIQQLAELMIEAEIDVNNLDEVAEYLGLLLEDIAGCECLPDAGFENIHCKVLAVIESL